MKIEHIANDILEFFQQIEPGTTAMLKVGSAVGVAGKYGVAVYQKGKQFVTYIVTKINKKQPETLPSPITLEPVANFNQLVSKQDVAILIDINRRMLMDVSRHLDKNKIDADLIIITNDEKYSSEIKFLQDDKPEEWEEIVRDFSKVINAVKFSVGQANVHIFMSVPLPVAFGLGSVSGTVDNANIYHYHNGYYKVLETKRLLRF